MTACSKLGSGLSLEKNHERKKKGGGGVHVAKRASEDEEGERE